VRADRIDAEQEGQERGSVNSRNPFKTGNNGEYPRTGIVVVSQHPPVKRVNTLLAILLRIAA